MMGIRSSAGRLLVSAAIAGALGFGIVAGCGEGAEVKRRGLGSRADAAEACVGTLAHDRHAAANLACAVCHPCGGRLELALVTYPRGTSTAGGTIAVGAGDTPTTCTVACHGTTPIAWNAPGPLACTGCHAPSALPASHPAVPGGATRDDCLACHDLSGHTTGAVRVTGHPDAWTDPASPGFHAAAANQGLAACQGCHRADLTGGITGVSCASCHDRALPAGVGSWRVNCVMCHGGDENPTGAPPKATWGQGADPVRVGAHSKHVVAGPLSPAIGCVVCHPVPEDALSAGHVSGAPAAVTFTGLGAARTGDPAAWDRAAATCSSTYCHGQPGKGGANPAPVWTGGAAQATCGSCHGLPPPSPHPQVGTDLQLCAICHKDTVDAAGAVIPPALGGRHLDGFVQASGHEAEWMDEASPGFHAFSADRGVEACKPCHGDDLEGGSSRVSCADCHGAGFRTDCTMCHGTAGVPDGAPPRATWGNGADPVRVGAHQAHVGAGGIAAAISCDACHPTNADLFTPGHLAGPTASVTFRGPAVQGGAAPSWDRGGASCAATYCHGNYSGTYTYWSYEEEVSFTYTGLRATASWTGGPLTCGSCHGNPPRGGNAWHSGSHGYAYAPLNDCSVCHPDAKGTGAAAVITDPSRHVNGTVDVAPQWRRQCFSCHA